VVPRPDSTIPEWRKRLYRRVPFVQRVVRLVIYLYREWSVLLFRHPVAMRYFQRAALRYLERSVADPVLRARLTPQYTMGCKRILLSNGYYPAMTRPNVELVTCGVAEVRAHSIVDAAGVDRDVDAIIFGTGFRPTDPPLAARISGSDGRTMRDVWQGSPKAYMGTTLAGFPNLFMLLGPNTGLGHNSVVYMTEAQIGHFIAALEYARRRGIESLEPTPDAQAQYVAALDQRMQGTVWVSGGCRSWYLDRTGRNSTLWPDSSWRFYRRVSHFDPAAYVAHA
jgi:cation diffusion facilitator CzcD-associated flavoprotein CzcO